MSNTNTLNNKKYFLHTLINVFDVEPCFLLPVFSDGIELFFQVITNNVITDFEHAYLTEFSNCKMHHVFDPNPYTLQSNALYSIQIPNSAFFYGDSVSIVSYFSANISILKEHSIA